MENHMENASGTALVPVTPHLNLPGVMTKSYFENLDQLTRKANEKQPPKPGEFTQRAAAIHEASHCVIARLEGKKLKSASIWRKDGKWLGEFLLAGKPEFWSRKETEKLLSHLRITLAGRRGELLFEPEFCLRAGLDELVYSHLMIMVVIGGMGMDWAMDYADVWGTTLVEVDEPLRKYEHVVRAIADRLMITGEQDRRQLGKALSAVEERRAPPPIRKGVKLDAPFDPLASG
jgi:hypothetical protein